MDVSEDVTFTRMAAAYPVRTAIFTVGPLLFALVQLANGVFHDVPLWYVVAFVVLLLGFSVQLNRLHLATFRKAVLAGSWETLE